LNNPGITQNIYKESSSTIQNIIKDKADEYNVNREHNINVNNDFKKDLILESKSIKKNKTVKINLENYEESLDEIIMSDKKKSNKNDIKSSIQSKSFDSEANNEIEENMDKNIKESFACQSNMELGNQILNNDKLFNQNDSNYENESEFYDRKYKTVKNRAHFDFDEIKIAKFNTLKNPNNFSK
jgi:hypothetical protein